MITEGNTTGAPNLASTLHAPDGSIPSDRWTGTTLGKYHIVRRLGRGGMGVVYEAKDPVLQRSVALKVLRDGIAAQPEAVRKFLREARTAARLNHHHIVSVYEADQEKGMCYLVMELMEGGSAHDRIRSWGPFGWVEATQVLADACRGLAAVHAAGLIHRDVKPSNIMRAEDGTVKIADFGLALTTTGSTETSTPNGQVVGTPLYMSPEQCRAEKIDGRSDIYSLGATYYTLLTGLPPFEGQCAMDIMNGHCSRPAPNPCEGAPFIPTACADLIRRTMAKNPAERPATAEALLAEIEAVLLLATSPDIQPLAWVEHNDLTPASSTLVEPVSPSPLARRTRFWFVTICLLLMGGAYGAGRYFSRDRTPSIAAEKPVEENPAKALEPTSPSNKTPAIKTVEFEAGSQVNSLSFDSRDRDNIAWGTALGSAKVVWFPHRTNRYESAVTKQNRPQPIEQVAFSPPDWKGRYWVGLFNGRLEFRETDRYERILDDPQYDSIQTGRIRAFAFHPQEELIALAFANETVDKGGILFRHLATDPQDREKLMEDGQPPRCLAFSTDGSLLVCGKSNRTLHAWRISFPKNPLSGTKDFVVKENGTIQVVESGEMTALAAIDADRFAVALGSKVIVYDCKQGEKREEIHDGALPVTCVAVSPKAGRVACGFGNRVAVYDLTGLPIGNPFEHPDPVTALAFDGDGKQLASGDARGKVIIWPVR